MANPIAIRSAEPGELDRAVDTIALAFAADPFTRWVFPSATDHLHYFRAILRAFGSAALPHKSVYVAGDFTGAAMWLPPGVEPDAAVFEALIEEMPGPNKAGFLQVFAQMQANHPHEPHWYLPMIGVDPAHQSAGIGSALMRHALARSDEARLPAYLESSNPANISLYQRQGFEVICEIRVDGSPVVTPMFRRPR